MTEQEKKIEKLKELLKILEDGITKEEFVKSFKNVVDLVLKTELSLSTKQNRALNDLKASFSELEAKVGEYSTKEISGAINSLQARVEKSMKEEANLMNFIRDKIRKIKEGRDGKDGLPGRTGKDGRDADENKIIKEILAKIEIPDLKELEKKIKELEAPRMTIFGGNRPLMVQGAGVVKDKVTRVINFTGATVTRDASGVVNVAISAGVNFMDDETPVNSGDDLNFTLSETPIVGSLKLYRGGARQRITEDFTLVGAIITLNIALASGEILLADYRY